MTKSAAWEHRREALAAEQAAVAALEAQAAALGGDGLHEQLTAATARRNEAAAAHERCTAQLLSQLCVALSPQCRGSRACNVANA